jgi:ribosomal protein L25 (general stress protein Ctc)
MYGIFGREITKYTVYIYGYGQPYVNLCIQLNVLESIFRTATY